MKPSREELLSLINIDKKSEFAFELFNYQSKKLVCKSETEIDIINEWWDKLSSDDKFDIYYMKNLKPNNPDNTDNLLVPIYTLPPNKPYKRNVKISYLEKWIKKGNFEVFTLEQFFEQQPKQKRNDSLDRHLSGLVDKKMIAQLGKTKFRVNRDRW